MDFAEPITLNRKSGEVEGSAVLSIGSRCERKLHSNFCQPDPDFLPRGTKDDLVCGFHQGKPHGLRGTHRAQQEIPGEWSDCGSRTSVLPASSKVWRVEGVEVGQQDDALLFVGVGAGDDGDGVFRRARVVGQVRHVGGDVEKITWLELVVVFELVAVPHAANAAEQVDRGFVRGVFVGLGAAAGRDGEQLHVDGLGTHRFRGDGGGIHEALFALEGFARADEPAGGVGGGGFADGRHGGPHAMNCLPR